jgi:hydroxymethylbilane synthase
VNTHSKKRLRIATRKSPLALWQAQHVARQIATLHAGLEIELVPLGTEGDRITHVPLGKIGGKGLFVKELEHALLEGRADIAAHSMKDVPIQFPPGLHLSVILPRAEPRDALVAVGARTLKALPDEAKVGTCSLRRQCQLRAHRPDLELLDLRGNVDTRLQKLGAGGLDAIILAAAGLQRLGLAERIGELLPIDIMLPAIGQGAIGIECRQNDKAIETLIAPLNHSPTATCVRAERAMNAILGGSCQVPIAAYATIQKNRLHLRGLVGRLDGSELLREEGDASTAEPEKLGQQVAAALLDRGAAELLASIAAGD